MTEDEFVETYLKAVELQTEATELTKEDIRLSNIIAEILYEQAEFHYNESCDSITLMKAEKIIATKNQLAYAINICAMDLSGDYSEYVVGCLINIYMKRVEIVSDHMFDVEHIKTLEEYYNKIVTNPNSMVLESDYTFDEDEAEEIFPEDLLAEKNWILNNVMCEFLDNVMNDETHLLHLIDALVTDDDPKLLQLFDKLNVKGYTKNEFLFWWNARHCSIWYDYRFCISTMDTLLLEQVKQGYKKEVMDFLQGEEVAFKFLLENGDLRESENFDYEFVKENYLDKGYGLRVLLKIQGVVFPEDFE